jgi:hypothetical protein
VAVVYDQTSGVDYSTISAAITGSSANDVLLVPAGSYDENFPAITHNLTIDAVGGLASLTTPQPIPVNGRAILDVPLNAGVNLSISGLEISGAVDNENNGAGILFEIGNGVLKVSNSWIHNNQDGILTGAPTASSPGGVMTVTINQARDPNSGDPNFDANIPATIDGNTLYNLGTSNLFSDEFGPLFDNASNNVFLSGPGPTLDTSPGYDVIEPGGLALLQVAVIGSAMTRLRRNIIVARG